MPLSQKVTRPPPLRTRPPFLVPQPAQPVSRCTEWGGMKLNMGVAGRREYMSAVMEIVLHGLTSREESVCSNAIYHVCRMWPSPVQRRFLLNGVKSTAGPRPKGCSVTGPWNVVSPALPFVMLCLLGGSLLRPMIAVQRARRGRKGRKGCTLERSALGVWEPASLSSLVGRGGTYVASAHSHPHQKARPLLCPSPKLPPLHPTASPQQKVHSTTAHAKTSTSTSIVRALPKIFRTILRFGSATRTRTDWTSHPKRVQLHAFNCLPSWMGNIYTLSSRHPSRFIFVDLLLEAPLTTVNRSLGPPPISDSCSPQKTNSL
jgi:hypothetical protein